MPRQHPTLTTPDQVEAARKADGPGVGSGTAGYLNGPWATRRRRQMPGETELDARARFERESEIERERDADPRLVGNQVLAIRYD